MLVYDYKFNIEEEKARKMCVTGKILQQCTQGFMTNSGNKGNLAQRQQFNKTA